jgi:hypothetical protein
MSRRQQQVLRRLTRLREKYLQVQRLRQQVAQTEKSRKPRLKLSARG